MTNPPDDLIPITAAAEALGRSVFAIRRWAERGHAPTGQNVTVYRDEATNIRWFSRREIDRIRASLFRIRTK